MTDVPNANDAERALLGAILSRGLRNLEDLHLHPEDFYQPRHEAVYGAVERVVAAGNRPDAVAVRVALGQDTSAGLFLAELMEACPVGAQVEYYAELVGNAADRRGMAVVRDHMDQMIQSGADPAEIQDQVTKELTAVPRRGGSVSRRWSDMDPSIIDHIEHGARRGIPTPWPALNKHLVGLVGSRMYTIAARPGEGKSLMGQALAVDAAINHRKRVLFASLEMSELDLGVRIYSDQANVPMHVLLSSHVPPHHWDAINKASNKLRGMGCHVNADPNQSVADIRAEARSMRAEMIVVDYLQLVKPASKRGDRREQVDQIARDLKLLAKELDVPVVALAQLNRGSEQRADRTPAMSDLRESGAIEQDSDIVLLMQFQPETGELKVNIPKNRHGSKGPFTLELWGQYSRIVQGAA